MLVEKHVTMSREEGGVDSAFSLEPDELAALVRETKVAWQALGEPRIGAREAEREGLRFRRSLFVVEDVKAGDPVTAANVRSIRPADGLPPDVFASSRAAPSARRRARDAAALGPPLTRRPSPDRARGPAGRERRAR